MKTQTEINKAFRTLLTVDLSGYDLEKYPSVWAIFMAEYGWRVNQLNGDHAGAVKEWMLGLPSIFNMPFSYHDIGNWLIENTGYEGDCFDSDIQDKRYWTKAALIFIKLHKGVV